MRLPPQNHGFRHGVPRSIDGIALPTGEEDVYDFSDIGRCDDPDAEVDVDDLLENDRWENFGNDWDNNNDGNSDFMSIYTFDDETIKTDFQSNACGGIVLEGVPEDVGEDLKKKRKQHKKERKREAAASAREEIDAFLSASKSIKGEGETTTKGETTISTDDSIKSIKDIKHNFEPATPTSPATEEPKVKDLIHVWSKQARIQRRKDAKVRKLISTYNTRHFSSNGSIVGSIVSRNSRLSTKKMPSQKRYAPAAVLTAATTTKKTASSTKKIATPAGSSPKKSSSSQKNSPARSSPIKSSKPAKEKSSPTRGLLKKTYRGLATIIEQSNVTPSNNFWKQREERQKKEKALTKGRGWKFWKTWSKPKREEKGNVKPVQPSVATREVLENSFSGNSTTSVTSGSDEEENLVQQRIREWPMQEVEGDTQSVYSASIWC